MIINFESFLINILRRPLFWQVVSLIPSWYKIYLTWYWLDITYQFFVLPFKESTFWWWERKCLGCVQGSTLTRLGDSNFRFSNCKGLTLSYVSHYCLKSFIIIIIFLVTCRFIIGSPRWTSRAGVGCVRAAPERSASPRLFSSLKIGLNSPWQLVSWTRRALRQSGRFHPWFYKEHLHFTEDMCTPRVSAAPRPVWRTLRSFLANS